MSKRWEIHYAFLDPVIGNEQAGNRPVLIISKGFHRSGSSDSDDVEAEAEAKDRGDHVGT